MLGGEGAGLPGAGVRVETRFNARRLRAEWHRLLDFLERQVLVKHGTQPEHAGRGLAVHPAPTACMSTAAACTCTCMTLRRGRDIGFNRAAGPPPGAVPLQLALPTCSRSRNTRAARLAHGSIRLAWACMGHGTHVWCACVVRMCGVRVWRACGAPSERHLSHLEVGHTAQADAELVEQRVAVLAAVACVLHHARVFQNLPQAQGVLVLAEVKRLHAAAAVGAAVLLWLRMCRSHDQASGLQGALLPGRTASATRAPSVRCWAR